MKSLVVGTSALMLAVSGSALASAQNSGKDLTIKLNAEEFAALSKPQAIEPNDSFLVVDGAEQTSQKLGEQGLADSRLPDRKATGSANDWSVESSGSPVNPSGVPAPGAGWISFFGVVCVIAARRLSRSRVRGTRAM